jgi:aspartate/methionine/tyrosine aminotransferase
VVTAPGVQALHLGLRCVLAPGMAFGMGGEGAVRLCYASDRPLLEEAMERLARFLPRWAEACLAP